jgi:hypothetical protein
MAVRELVKIDIVRPHSEISVSSHLNLTRSFRNGATNVSSEPSKPSKYDHTMWKAGVSLSVRVKHAM